MGGRNRRRRPGERSELARHLAGLRGEQAAKRTQLYPQTALDELRAASRLAYELFGSWGSVEIDHSSARGRTMGVMVICKFIEPPRTTPGPKIMRKSIPMFQGATLTELHEQAALWKAKRS